MVLWDSLNDRTILFLVILLDKTVGRRLDGFLGLSSNDIPSDLIG